MVITNCVYAADGGNLIVMLLNPEPHRMIGTHAYEGEMMDDYRPGGPPYDDIVVRAGEVRLLGRIDWTLREDAFDLPRQIDDPSLSESLRRMNPELAAAARFLDLPPRESYCSRKPEDCVGL